MVEFAEEKPIPQQPERRPEPAAGAWIEVLVAPRAAFTTLLREESEGAALLLTGLAGTLLLLAGAHAETQETTLRLVYLLFFCLCAGPMLGWFFLYFFSALLTWVGDWLGGRGVPGPVRGAVGWSSLPVVLTSVPYLLLKGAPGTGWLPAAGAVYALVLLVAGLSVAHRFSLARATLCLALVLVLALLPALGILAVYGLLILQPS